MPHYSSGAETTVKLVGRNLARWRGDRGMSLDDLAVRSGISAERVAQIEAGLTEPRLDDLHQLAVALKIELRQLFAPASRKS